MDIKLCKDILNKTAEGLLNLSDRLSGELGTDLTDPEQELLKIGTLSYISNCLTEAKYFYVSGLHTDLQHSLENILRLSDITTKRNESKLNANHGKCVKH